MNEWWKHMQANCRTCCHSTATPESTWTCARYENQEIPLTAQREGCDDHILHPDLVPYKQKESSHEWQTIWVIDGKDVANGDPDANVYSSKEILANPSACANPDSFMQEMRRDMGARVTG